MSRRILITNGQRFDGTRLTLVRELEPTRYQYPNGKRTVKRNLECLCDCGTTVYTNLSTIRQGQSKSCGCYKKEKATTHGDTGKPLNNVFKLMHQRCYNKQCPAYANYGQRGIVVCDEWHDYETFKKWAIAAGYKKGLQIDRKNPVIDNYAPENCRWIPQTNDRVQSNTRWWVIGDVTYASKSLAAKCERVPDTTIHVWCNGGYQGETKRQDCYSIPRFDIDGNENQPPTNKVIN